MQFKPPFARLLALLATLPLLLAFASVPAFAQEAPADVDQPSQSSAALPPTAEFSLTEQRVFPAQLNVVAGMQVVWVNNASLPLEVSRQPLSSSPPAVFLPLVHGAVGSAATQMGQSSPNGVVEAPWANSHIALGARFSRIFASAGALPLYASNLVGEAGEVNVVTYIVRTEIAPGAALLTTVGQTMQLMELAFDIAGARV